MSPASAKLQEPSMEDILTSIRRIIAEDEASAPQRPPVPPPTANVRGRDISEPAPATNVAAPATTEPSVAEEPALRAAEPPSLVSATTEAAFSEALGRLGATPALPPLRSLEDAVTEMLRPMLKAWLDDNLPGLVERLVKAEIERLTRAAR